MIIMNNSNNMIVNYKIHLESVIIIMIIIMIMIRNINMMMN